jgi:single-stranded DNA-binding protein
MRVIVTGVLEMQTYEAKDGTRRNAYQITAEEVGLSLRLGTATFHRGQAAGAAAQPAATAAPQPAAAVPAMAAAGDGFGGDPFAGR